MIIENQSAMTSIRKVLRTILSSACDDGCVDIIKRRYRNVQRLTEVCLIGIKGALRRSDIIKAERLADKLFDTWSREGSLKLMKLSYEVVMRSHSNDLRGLKRSLLEFEQAYHQFCSERNLYLA